MECRFESQFFVTHIYFFGVFDRKSFFKFFQIFSNFKYLLEVILLPQLQYNIILFFTTKIIK
jgi:hypothetical protein